MAVCCSVLQCVALCCSVLQGAAIRFAKQFDISDVQRVPSLCIIQCVVVCCSVLQCVVACCRVWQSVAGCCKVLQGFAGCCTMSRQKCWVPIFMTFNVCLACVLQSVAVFALCHSVLQGVAAPFP